MTEDIQRGDIWTIRFDPSEGDEIQKIRPAVIMTAAGAGKIPHMFWAIPLLLIAFWLRIHLVNESNYNWDEAFSRWIAQLPFYDALERTANDVHPPLYYMLLHVSRHLFGDNEFSLRFPSVLLSTLTVAVTYAIGFTVAGRRVGLLAMLFMAISRTNIANAQLARMYTLAAFFLSGALWAVIIFLKDLKQRSAAVVYILCVVGALYSFYLSITLLLATNLTFLYGWLRRERHYNTLIIWVSIHVIIIALFMPWFVYAFPRTADISSGESQTLLFMIKFYFVTLLTGIPTNWGSYLNFVWLALAGGAVGITLLFFTIRHTMYQKIKLLLLINVTLAVMGVIVFLTLPYHTLGRPLTARYLPLLSSGFYVLMAWSTLGFRKHRYAGVLLTMLVITNLLLGLSTYYSGRVWHDQFTSLAETLEAHRRPEDSVILHTYTDWPIWIEAYPEHSWVGISDTWRFDAALAEDFVEPIWWESEAVWLVTTPQMLLADPTGEVHKWLERQALATRRWSFNEYSLSLYVRTPERVGTMYDLTPGYAIPGNVEGGIDGLIGLSTTADRYIVGDHLYLSLYWQEGVSDEIDIRMLGTDFERNLNFQLTTAQSGITRQVLDIPITSDMATGEYRVLLDDTQLHKFHVLNSVHYIDADRDSIPNKLNLRLGESIHLLGYDVSTTTVSPGEELTVTIYWLTNSPIDKRYKVSIFIIGEFNQITNNPLWGQLDSEPFNWQLPTTQWPTGVILADSYTLSPVEYIPDGEYGLGVVMYELMDGQRLDIYDSENIFIGDMATLTEIIIR